MGEIYQAAVVRQIPTLSIETGKWSLALICLPIGCWGLEFPQERENPAGSWKPMLLGLIPSFVCSLDSQVENFSMCQRMVLDIPGIHRPKGKGPVFLELVSKQASKSRKRGRRHGTTW